MIILATLGSRSKRRAPAAPGLTTHRPSASRDQLLVRVAVHDHVGVVAREQLRGRRDFRSRDRG